MPRLLFILAFLPLAAIARAQTTAPSTTSPGPVLPTAAEVRGQVDDGQYRDALKNLLRILDLKGPPAAAYDRAEMLLLRAECQLQVRESQAAQSALDAAVKEARGGNGIPPNADQLGKALALAALVAKSPNMLYNPRSRTGPLTPKPINILDRAQRATAYKALFEDSLPDVKARVHAAAGVNVMPPVLEAAKAVATLRALEQAGTGDDAQSAPIAAELAARAVMLLGNSVVEMNGVVDSLATSANWVATGLVQRVDPVSGLRTLDQTAHRRGLVGDEPARLKSIQQTCNQIITTCWDLQLALDASDFFQAVAVDANTVSQRAGKVLAGDYSR